MNKANRKYLTHRSYEMLLNKHVIPRFGKRKINSIKPSDLIEWQNDLLKNMCSKSVINARIIFHGIFEDALRDEIIDKNPLAIVKVPKLETIKKINPLSKDEIFSILDILPIRLKPILQ